MFRIIGNRYPLYVTVLMSIFLVLKCTSSIECFKKTKQNYNENKTWRCTIAKNGKTMRCYGNGTMNTIPVAKNNNISRLVIIYGSFINVTKQTFAPVAKSSVKHLHMNICKIKTLTSDAFFYLKELYTIDLSQNIDLNVTYVAKSLHSLGNSSSIKAIIFNKMRWTWFPEKMFDGLINTSVNEIQLSHNYFTTINCSIFGRLTTLRNLSLGWTGLSDNGSSFSGLSQIQKLDLSGTWFSRFPNFCDRRNTSVVHNLKELYLDNSKINSISCIINCLDSLQRLNLSGLSLRILYPNIFSRLKSLQSLKLANLGSQFRKVMVSSFNSSTLQSLTFSINSKHFFRDKNNRNFNASYLFTHCKQLHHLDMSYNSFLLLGKTWNAMLSPLQNLTTLSLKDTQINNIPKIDKTLPGLKYLDLSNNKISSWVEMEQTNPFSGFRNLRILNLKNNLISLINKTSFPEKWMDGTGTLRKLILSGNPFSCTCKLSWFRDWMDTAIYTNVSTDQNEWQCSISRNSLKSYHPDQSFECLMPYVITAVLTFIFILLLGFICYILRFKIKLAWYRCTSRKKDYTILCDIDFKYDSFIVYSYEDLWWIQQYAIPQLEENNNRNICIRDRDFRLGTVFSNAIIRNIRASRSVLFLLSDNFAKDKWCRFQMDITNCINICESNMIKVIPVMLHQEVSFKNMNDELFQIIKHQDYIQWQQGGSKKKLFWISILEHIPKGVNMLETSFSDGSVQLSDSGIYQ